MKNNTSLHPAQSTTLFELRHRKQARFSELMAETGMTSDAYKFHLRKLTKFGYVQKDDDGWYELTPSGKEFANRLDEQSGHQLAQPKASTLLVVISERNNETVYLAHQRQREPFYSYWGIASAPLAYGRSIYQSTGDEFAKQSGLSADFQYRGTLHVTDALPDNTVLEDKLFLVMQAKMEGCPDPYEWYAGKFAWMSLDELINKPRVFPTTEQTIAIAQGDTTFGEAVCVYPPDMY